MTNVQLNGNGTGADPVNSAVANALQDDMTVGYRPTIPLEALWLAGAGDAPQITLRRDIEFMQLHPIVISSLEYYRSGTSGAEFWGGPDHNNPENEKGKPISPNQRVAEFVLAHVERFWQRGVPVLQDAAYPYGWAPGEHMYKDTHGMMVWDHLKGFHPNDSHVLTIKGNTIGLRIKNVRDPVGTTPDESRGGHTDLWFASEHIPAKAAWYPHRPRFGQFYGRSQLAGAWRPWRRLGWRDGVEQVVDSAVYRAGYCGPIVSHPLEDMQTATTGIPATRADGRGMPRRSARDVARQMIEWAKAGAGFTIPSEQYPASMGGGPKWSVTFPEHVMDVGPLLKACEYLEDQIMLGIGVPPELVRAGGTGSGYSGRSIPREAFLDQQQRIADAMLQIFVEQVIRPLVLWNFGDVPFEVACKPLLKTQSENKQGQPKPPLPQPDSSAQGGGQPPPDAVPPGQPPSGGLAMSMGHEARVISIIQRVLKRSAA